MGEEAETAVAQVQLDAVEGVQGTAVGRPLGGTIAILRGMDPHPCEMVDLVSQANAASTWDLRGFLVPDECRASVGTEPMGLGGEYEPEGRDGLRSSVARA